jgi:hypothetical protein
MIDSYFVQQCKQIGNFWRRRIETRTMISSEIHTTDVIVDCLPSIDFINNSIHFFNLKKNVGCQVAIIAYSTTKTVLPNLLELHLSTRFVVDEWFSLNYKAIQMHKRCLISTKLKEHRNSQNLFGHKQTIIQQSIVDLTQNQQSPQTSGVVGQRRGASSQRNNRSCHRFLYYQHR